MDRFTAISIYPFSESDHALVVRGWLTSRDIKHDVLDSLPKIGFMCCMDEFPVAVAFLRQVEGSLAIFDGLCTNPLALPKVRDLCLDFAVDRLIKEAKIIGIKGIIAWTKDKHTLMRANKHGFMQLPDAVIFLNLR